MSTILITGVNGQLGSEIQNLSKEYQKYNFVFTDVDSLDITKLERLSEFCLKTQIDCIINCAAYTAVDKAESERNISNSVNHLAVKNLSIVAKDLGIKLVHVSTDYVFDGKNYKPFKEEDTTNPINVYGETKLYGEQAMLEQNPSNSVIIRTSWVYSSFGKNFVKTIMKLAKEKQELGIIGDQIGSPTYAFDLAKTILEILPKIKNNQVEIYHYSNEGVCSWYDFAFEICSFTESKCKVFPIETKDYPTAAERPLYSVMNKTKIKSKFGLDIPHWKTALERCLKKMK